jgi:DNA polymerase-3 subunit beta
MNAKVARAELLRGISTVQNVVSGKATLPALSNVLLDAKEGSITFSATDLKVTIECSVNAEIDEKGMACVPAAHLASVVREMPDQEIVIEKSANDVLSLSCGTIQFRLLGMAANEFPRTPECKAVTNVVLKQEALGDILERTAFSVGTDQSRYILTGLLLELNKGLLRSVATDGRRLSFGQTVMDCDKKASFRVVVPEKTIREVQRLVTGEGEIEIVVGEAQVLFVMSGTRLTSTLIEGDFPDYNRVIPKRHNKQLVVRTMEFAAAVRRAAAVTSKKYHSIKVKLLPGLMVFGSVTPEIGEETEEMAADYDGDELEVAFNPDYLLQALAAIRAEETVLEVRDQESAGVLRPQGSEDYAYVVMPIRI